MLRLTGEWGGTAVGSEANPTGSFQNRVWLLLPDPRKLIGVGCGGDHRTVERNHHVWPLCSLDFEIGFKKSKSLVNH